MLSNAWKYSSKQLEPKIEFGTVAQQNGKVAYFVKDNGVGFDMSQANKLFCTFSRLHTETEFKGIGIGLTIIQRVIHWHNGNIWVEAKPNEGATFYFTLG